LRRGARGRGANTAPRNRGPASTTGRYIDEAIATEAAHAALEGATPLTENAYKLPLLETLIRRAILTT